MPLTFKVAIRTIVVPVQRTSEARPSYYYGAIGYQWSYCSSLPGARQAYLDRELCGVRPDGITSFSMIQMASDAGNAAGLVFFLFDLLYLDGENLAARSLTERKARPSPGCWHEPAYRCSTAIIKSGSARPSMRKPA